MRLLFLSLTNRKLWLNSGIGRCWKMILLQNFRLCSCSCIIRLRHWSFTNYKHYVMRGQRPAYFRLATVRTLRISF